MTGAANMPGASNGVNQPEHATLAAWPSVEKRRKYFSFGVESGLDVCFAGTALLRSWWHEILLAMISAAGLLFAFTSIKPVNLFDVLPEAFMCVAC